MVKILQKKSKKKKGGITISSSLSRKPILNKYDQELVSIARDVIEKGATRFLGSWENPWKNVKAGVFITAYKTKNDLTSENVWCCMSNGEYKGKQSVWQNVLQAAKICATKDSRRTTSIPGHIEISILNTEDQWKLVKNPIDDLKQQKHKSIYIEDGEWSAIYLPSVWDERSKIWSAQDLLLNLGEKAGLPSWQAGDVYEIDTWEINEEHSNTGGARTEENMISDI
jgi:AMMECR1 domain-containing protein